MPRLRPKRSSACLLAVGAPGQHRADAARGGEQLGGLRLDHREIIGFGRRRCRWWSSAACTSPSAITAEARDRISSTRSEPSSTISSNARLNRKSPTSTAGLLPHTAFAVSRPRRRSLASTTSSCSRVAVWMNSTAAASADVAVAAIAAHPRAAQGQHRPQPLAAAGDDVAGKLRDQRSPGCACARRSAG